MRATRARRACWPASRAWRRMASTQLSSVRVVASTREGGSTALAAYRGHAAVRLLSSCIQLRSLPTHHLTPVHQAWASISTRSSSRPSARSREPTTFRCTRPVSSWPHIAPLCRSPARLCLCLCPRPAQRPAALLPASRPAHLPPLAPLPLLLLLPPAGEFRRRLVDEFDFAVT